MKEISWKTENLLTIIETKVEKRDPKIPSYFSDNCAQTEIILSYYKLCEIWAEVSIKTKIIFMEK